MEDESNSPSAPICDDSEAQSWAAMNEEEELKEEVEFVEEEKSHPPTHASIPTPPAAVPHERDSHYVPSYVSRHKLLSVGLDPVMDTALLVTLRTDEAMLSPPQVDRSRFALNPEGKQKLVEILLGSTTGFGIKLPDIPRVLVTGTTTSAALDACNSLSGPRGEWWASLRQMAQQQRALMREIKLAANDAARDAVCDELWAHLEKVTSRRSTSTRGVMECERRRMEDEGGVVWLVNNNKGKSRHFAQQEGGDEACGSGTKTTTP